MKTGMDIRALVVISVSIGMTVAASPGIDWNPYVNRDIPSPNRYNYFDTELLEVLTRHEDGNVLVSPLAVKISLEMLMEAAVGRSAEEIRMALRFSKEGDGSNRQELPLRLYSLQAGGATSLLNIATKIFVADRSQINPEYQLSMKKLGSDIAKVRFQYPREVADIINKWAASSTSGMITKLADEAGIDPQSTLMLANAVYFKGKWLQPFAKKNTNLMCFRTGNNCIQVPMMTDSGSYEYAYIPKLDADAINIPYEGGRFSILLVLPKKNDCRQLSRDMLHVGLEEILSQLHEQEVHVRIPKFTIESKGDLRPYLQKMNILEVFGPRAEINRIFSGQRDPAVVNKVLHSAKIDVNEEGTEAAAAIASLFVPLMGGTPTSFIADHPFLFFVRDKVTGTVLFSGKLERPDGEMKTKPTSSKPSNTFNAEGVTKTIGSPQLENSHYPDARGGSVPLSRRTLAVEEVERTRYLGRQLYPPYLQMGNERYHASLEKGNKLNQGRNLFFQDAISFEHDQPISVTDPPFERRKLYVNYPKYK